MKAVKIYPGLPLFKDFFCHSHNSQEVENNTPTFTLLVFFGHSYVVTSRANVNNALGESRQLTAVLSAFLQSRSSEAQEMKHCDLLVWGFI